MNRTWLSVALIGGLHFGGALSPVPGQAPSPSVEQQLRSQYRVASVGSNGVVVRAGTVLVVAQDGIKANPPSGPIYWYNSHKPGGRIKYSVVFESLSPGDLRNQVRPLQVGEKVLVARLEVKPRLSEVELYVQTLVDSPNDAPYRACVVFQFPRGYVDPANLKAIQDSITEVFSLDTASPPPPPPGPPPPHLPASYVSAQTPTDQLQLNADNTFSLQEAGQMYRGTFTANGATVELHISGGPTSTATIQGDNLTDSGGQTWVLQKQQPQAPGSPDVLQNQDILKMVKNGFDDATILAKISSSKCHFDTSTDALIQLKQGGASAAVLKAVVAAGR